MKLNRWASMAGCGWPTSKPASRAVQPDADERYALAAFAGSPESGLRACLERTVVGLLTSTLHQTKSAHSSLGWRMNGLKAQAEEMVLREIVYAE